MFQSLHQFFIQVSDQTDSVVHREEVEDFLPCYEDLLFSAVCAGAVPNNGELPIASIKPVWRKGEHGIVEGVIVSVPPLTRRYGLEVFARRAWEVLVRNELVKNDEQGDEAKKFTWSIEAQERKPESKRRLRIAVSRRPYPLVQRDPAELGIVGTEAQDESFSVCISRNIIKDLKNLSADSLDEERADILTGHLLQGPAGTAKLAVTGRIPAVTETNSGRAHFTFSPLTFVAAERELSQRPDRETIVGWHHNHPPKCGRSCLENLPPCKVQTLFLSLDDRMVHAASFSSPYMIAAVSGKVADTRADDPSLRVYGWQDAVITERPYSQF